MNAVSNFCEGALRGHKNIHDKYPEKLLLPITMYGFPTEKLLVIVPFTSIQILGGTDQKGKLTTQSFYLLCKFFANGDVMHDPGYNHESSWFIEAAICTMSTH